MALEVDCPVIEHPHALANEFGVADVEGPDPEGRVDDLGPDTLLVGVREPQHRVVGSRRTGLVRVDVGGAGQVDLCGAWARHGTAELLAVDVDRFEGAVGVLDAAGHAPGEVSGQVVLEQPPRLDQVGVARVGPDLVVAHVGAPLLVLGRNRLDMTTKSPLPIGYGTLRQSHCQTQRLVMKMEFRYDAAGRRRAQTPMLRGVPACGWQVPRRGDPT